MFTTHRKVPFSGNLPPISDGLVGRWLFDEPSGDTAIDSSVEGNDGTLLNNPQRFTDGVRGPALALQNDDSVDIQAVSIPNDASINVSTSFSLSMWINTDGAFFQAGGALLHKDPEAPNRSFYFNVITSTGRLRFLISSTGSNAIYRDGSTDLGDSTWHHVAGVYDSSAQTLSLYVGGVSDNGALTGTVPTSINTNTSFMAIGMHVESTIPYDGSISDARFYNRALTPAEILSIYNGTG